MTDLKLFGKALRESREGRGITQEEAVSRSATYSEASSLRKIERGEQRPRRDIIVSLLVKGLEERDTAAIDQMLELAGYRGLTESEISRLGLSPRSVLRIPVQIPEPAQEKPARAELNPRLLKIWDGAIATCAVGSVGLGWTQDWFAWISCILYAGLFAVSVLLEAAPEFRKRETPRAALLAGMVVLASSMGGMLLDSHGVGVNNSSGLWPALVIFVLAAALQWLLVRPALPGHSIVRARFQAHTAQSAHLKNTLYFFLIVIAFWIPPRHCVGVLARQPALSGFGIKGNFCAPPQWLWALFVLVVGLSIPMGSRLLENLRPGPHHNLYINLFYARAALYFLLSVVCLIWYSSSF